MDKVMLCTEDKPRRNFSIRLPFLAFTLTILLLAGCGGGSSNGGNSVSPTNKAPVANDDIESTEANAPVDINVVQNDTDEDGEIDPTTVTIVTDPTNGIVNNKGGGIISYTADNGFVGEDSFTYTVKDKEGATSNEATARVTVNAIKVPPTAENSCGHTKFNETLNKEQLTDDLSVLVAPDTTDFRYNILNPATEGTVEVDPVTGIFTYTATAEGKIAAKLDSFTYEAVDDTDGSSATGEVKVIVGTLRIMPLGDSITAGIFGGGLPPAGERIGYRKKLYADLIADPDDTKGGFQVDFVGSQKDGFALKIGDEDHEGWPGKRIDQFTDDIVILDDPDSAKINPPKVSALLDENPADVILLHIGSNDINVRDVDTETDAMEVGAMLEDIDAWEDENNNRVTVFLALITDRLSATANNRTTFPNPDVTDFNNRIRSMASTRSQLGDEIVIVNQHDALIYSNEPSPDDDLSPDRVHPNSVGYEKMADTWLKRIIDSKNELRCTSSP